MEGRSGRCTRSEGARGNPEVRDAARPEAGAGGEQSLPLLSFVVFPILFLKRKKFPLEKRQHSPCEHAEEGRVNGWVHSVCLGKTVRPGVQFTL